MDVKKPTLNEIEELFREEEKKVLPKISFNKKLELEEIEYVPDFVTTKYNYDFTELVYSDYDFKPTPKKVFSLGDQGEDLFSRKTKEGWTFNFQFKIVDNEFKIDGFAYLNGLEKVKSSGKNLEAVFIEMFGQEEYDKLLFN